MVAKYERLRRIYRLKNSKNFYARIRLNGAEIKRSLGVADEDEAKFRAGSFGQSLKIETSRD